MPAPYRPAKIRFWEKVSLPDSKGCLLWMGGGVPAGYGVFYVGGGRRNYYQTYSHRFAYELAYGPIPEGMEIDHLCRVRGCVNPEHLEPVTHAENVRRSDLVAAARARAAARTECRNGHAMTPENTYARSGIRRCRTCQRAGAAAYRARQRAS